MTTVLVVIAAVFWTTIVAVVAFVKGYEAGWGSADALHSDMNVIMARNPDVDLYRRPE